VWLILSETPFTDVDTRSVTDASIEDALKVGPRHEWALFVNRDKFDLVAMYESSSKSSSLPNSPLLTLSRVIYEKGSQKKLRRMPVLLIGGLDAWKKEFGDGQMVEGRAGDSSIAKPMDASGLMVMAALISKPPTSEASRNSIPVQQLRYRRPSSTQMSASTPQSITNGSTSTSTSNAFLCDTQRGVSIIRNSAILPTDRFSTQRSTNTSNSPPLSPAVPNKPSLFSLTLRSSSTTSVPSAATVNTHGSPAANPVFPKILHQLMYKHKYKVLVLDVRSREEFDRAHIKADAIICIEPSVLLQEQYVNNDMNVRLYADNDHQGNWLNNREVSPRFSRP
jgi:hypothetical protein